MSTTSVGTMTTGAPQLRRAGSGSRRWRRGRLLLLVALAVPCAVGLTALGARAWLRTAFPPTSIVEYRIVENGSLKLHVFEHADRTQADRTQADLAQPDHAQLDKGIGRRPAIIFFFGGFWSVGAAEQFYPFARYFAERGYVALAVDYRVRWLHGTNVPVAVSDAAAALRWVADHADALNIDPARIVVAGSSSGGHMAAAAVLGLAGEPAPAVAAMVLLNPAVDTSFDNAPAIWGIVEPLFETKGRSLSPLHRLQRGAPPTLIFHGRSDRLVPIDQSRRFCAAMRDLGGVCDLREIAGAGHAFFNYGFGHFDEVAAGSADFLTRTFDRQEQERRGVR